MEKINNEIWLPLNITPFNEVYEVSNYGNVRRKYKNHYKKIYGTNFNGYLRVNLQYKGINRYFFIHRLIALAFIYNDNPKAKTTVHHKDHNRQNNKVNNLEWLSVSDNSKEAAQYKKAVKT